MSERPDMKTMKRKSQDALDRATRLLERFNDPALSDFRKLLRKETASLVAAATRIIDSYQRQRPIVFNPFLTSGFDPSEDDFTMGLAKLFDPREAHDLGKILLNSVLEAAREEARRVKREETIDSIIEALNTSDVARIRIERNFYHQLGRPDILVIGADATRFIIAIENKAPFGSETRTIHGVQTARYYEKILLPLCEKYGVAERYLLAIFLNPVGANASHPSFIPLSSNDLARSMLRTLDDRIRDEVDRAHKIPSEIILARAFITTFAWLNHGGVQ
jgi:hypothetical protein